MSIDKWLSKKDSKEERIKREKIFKSLSEGEVKELKKKKIRKIVQKESQNVVNSIEEDKFINEILEFKEWINQRTYLKGDIVRIETWIKNLYLKIQIDKSSIDDTDHKKSIMREYKTIPPNFLDEKTRVAINKKIHGAERTN
ncbi:MAG: hypothetical protein ACFFBE_05450, partial [Promethearchaeota archaeon]